MLRFDRFMQAALYHPERGYYTSRIQNVGTRGDFTTSAELSPLLGKAIAHEFRTSGLTHLIEVGPGSGQLSKTVRAHLPLLTRLRTQQHLVEVSHPLRRLQKEANPKATHHADLAAALKACNGRAFVFSNELVDAFPVRIFRKEEQGFSELHLEKKDGIVHEHFPSCPQLPDSTQLSDDHRNHQRCEVHESYQEWMTTSLEPFREGRLLTIDYALPQPAMLNGSLRGYFLQERITGPSCYQSAGHIDLTTDVSFEDLIRWGEKLGLRTLSLRTQTEFLTPFAEATPADQFLTDPEKAGGAFSVLLQSLGEGSDG